MERREDPEELEAYGRFRRWGGALLIGAAVVYLLLGAPLGYKPDPVLVGILIAMAGVLWGVDTGMKFFGRG